MQTEFEATFWPIAKDEMRERLERAGAQLVQAEFLQKRENFFPPQNDKSGWLRVRQEKDRVTMSYKRLLTEDEISGQKELCLTVDDYARAVEFLELLGCENKNHQETRREIWRLSGAEICLDTWPFLGPFLEAEADSEAKVKQVCQQLGLDYAEARFCAVASLYEEKYGVSQKDVNENFPRLVFEMKNPFVD